MFAFQVALYTNLQYRGDYMPKFQKEFPKDAINYFHPKYDEAYKKAHPVKYGVLVTCGLGVLVLPIFLLIFVTQYWYPAPNSGFLFMTMAGGFIIGVGLFNIVAAWINQYLGHWVTIGCILLGSSLVSISLVIIYNPNIYAKFDELMVTYYFSSLLFITLPPIFYLHFRFGVRSWLKRKRINKNTVKKLMKGRRNFWWYEALHQETDLGLIYHINKLVTILYPLNLVVALGLGWLRFMAPVVTGLYAIISVMIAGMLLFSSVQQNIDAYGKPIVILRITENHGLTSSFFDLTIAAFPLAAGYTHIRIMLDALIIPR